MARLTAGQLAQKANDQVEALAILVAQELNQVRNLVLPDIVALVAYKGGRQRILLQDGRSFVLDSSAVGTANNITDVSASTGGWWRLQGIPSVSAAVLGGNPTAMLQSVIDNTLASSVELTGLIAGLGIVKANGKTIYLKPDARIVARPLSDQEVVNKPEYGLFNMNAGGRIIGTGTIDGNRLFRTGIKSHGIYWENSTKPVHIEGPTFTGWAGDVIRCQNVAPPTIREVDMLANDFRGVHLIETDNAILDSVRIDGGIHGIQWWSGEGRFCQGITITNCQVKNVSGGGIWGYRGLGITITGGSAVDCGDYCYGFEGCVSSTVSGVFAANGTNAGLAFYNGCENVTYSNCHVRQGAGMGPGLKSFSPNRPGVGKNRNVTMTGGSIVCTSGTPPVNTDQDCTEDFRLIGVSLTGSWVQFLDVNHVKMLNCTVYTSSIYGVRQLGGNYGVFKGNTLFYTGAPVNESNEFCMTYRTEQYAAAYNVVEGNFAYGFGGGCFDDDQNGPLSTSGNRFIGNLTAAPVKQNKPNYSLVCRDNYRLDSTSVDGWERQFMGIVTGQGQAGYVPILTLPASAVNTFDHAVVVASVGNFEGGLKKTFTLSVGQRDGLSVNAICQGDNEVVPNSIVAYKTLNGQTTFYLKLGVFAEASVVYQTLHHATGVDKLILNNGSVPGGVLVYDSNRDKPNLEVGSAGLKSFGALIGGAAAGGSVIPSVATYQAYLDLQVSEPTLVNVSDDELTGRQDVAYWKTPRVARQLADVEKA